MLNPNKLRQKTQEATERIALERQREEERLHQEAEARRLEAERQRLAEEHKLHLRKLATRTWEEILKQSIQTAAQGGRSIQLETPAEVATLLETEAQLPELGRSLWLKTTFLSNWGLTLQRRLNVLSEKLRGWPHAEEYIARLTITQLPLTDSGVEKIRSTAVDVISEIEGDTECPLPEDAVSYIKRHLRPHLGTELANSKTAMLEVSWKPKDVSKVVMSELHDVPSWLLSNGGSGLIERIGQSMAVDADQGKNASIFELHPLPINPDRWGQNAMMKFVHGGSPIGVCPFAPEVFAQTMSYLGFKVAVGTAPTGPTLTLRW